MADTEARKPRKGFLWVENEVFDYYAQRLSPAVFMLYLALCRMANNHTQSCYPSQATLAGMIGVTERTIRTLIEELLTSGLVSREMKGKHYEYTLLRIPEKISGISEGQRKLEVKTPEISYQNTGSGLPLNNTNNNTQEQDLILSPPSSARGECLKPAKLKPAPKPKTGDPRYPEFIAAIKAGYDRREWPFAWSAKDGAQLTSLLKYKPKYSLPEFRICLKNYFDSEGTIPGAMPYTYLHKLPNYWAGPLNQYGKILQNKTARHEVLSV